MTPKQIREIAEAMRDCGIDHLKMEGFEMTCRRAVQAFHAPERESPHTTPAPVASHAHQEPETEEKEIIEHKVEQLASLMKLSDLELVDQLFPEPKDPEEDVA